MTKIHGTWDPRFDEIAELLSASIDAGTDLGASVAVTIDGDMVVDLWGGFADAARSRPWVEDTIVNVWSTTKTMTFLSALVLVERGLLDLDAPVATYWPEFAANGKEGVLVRHLFGHTSGVSAWEQPVVTADIYDAPAAAARLAAQAPWWEPGSASGYHALNQGHLIGELVRRIDGRTLGSFFAEELAGPLGADFHIGLPPEHDARVAEMTPPPAIDIDLATVDPIVLKTLAGPPLDATVVSDPAWRRAEIGAANGQGNARSVARIQALVANGGTLDGVERLSAGTIDRIFETQAEGPDLVLGEYVHFGMGYAISSAAVPYVPDGRVAYWGGWGGSVIIVDCDRRMTISYVMNRMDEGVLGDVRGESIVRAVYAGLG